MDTKLLPERFLADMKHILGEEFEDFLASYDRPAKKGLRLNTLKISPEELTARSGFHLTRVPWTTDGYVFEEEDMPSRHPFYSAGLYYLQEPSAMAPAQILPVRPGDRILDLCAAPGGKSTELGVRLQRKGLLVANEISASRVRALVRNVELFGIPNAVVTCETPERLLEHYPSCFDSILVDAPCSGEGMFRKDEGAVRTWSPEKVEECAAIQRRIIVEAAGMLRPGGYMVYSTCTFAPEENEMVILHLLKACPDMELVDIPKTGGRAAFSEGLSVPELRELGKAHTAEGCSEGADLAKTCRLWPHKIEGEGHFCALLRKKDLPGRGDSHRWTYGMEKDKDPVTGRAEEKENRRKKQKKANKKGSETNRDGMSPSDMKLVRDFITPYLIGSDIVLNEENLEVHAGKVYLMPDGVFIGRGIRTVRAGVYLGELKKERFEPEQELAMILPGAPEEKPSDKLSFCLPEDYLGRYVCLSPSDERIEEYLHGQTIPVRSTGKNGWRLLCAGRSPVGWGKLVNGQLKNKYPAGWRIP